MSLPRKFWTRGAIVFAILTVLGIGALAVVALVSVLGGDALGGFITARGQFVSWTSFLVSVGVAALVLVAVAAFRWWDGRWDRRFMNEVRDKLRSSREDPKG